MLTKLPLNISASQEVLNQASSAGFKLGVRNESDAIQILMHGVIGDGWEGMDSATVISTLQQNRGKVVNIDINSPGGLAYDGVSIYNALVAHDAPVNIDITGIAASAASLIAMAGDRIRIAENASFMIHRALTISIGNHKVMDETSEFLKKLDGQIAATYAARTGRKPETMLKMMDGAIDGTTMTGQEAVDNGFCTEVIPLKKKGKGKDKDGDMDASNSTETVANTTTEETPVTIVATAAVADLTSQFSEEAQMREQAVAVRLRRLMVDEE